MRVAVALTTSAIDRGGYDVLRSGWFPIQAASVDNADDEGKKPTPQGNRGQNLSPMGVKESHVCNLVAVLTLPASRVGTLTQVNSCRGRASAV